MTKKVLIAFDDSENAFRGVKYVADTFKTDTEITLFGVVPDVADICRMDSVGLLRMTMFPRSNAWRTQRGNEFEYFHVTLRETVLYKTS
jgi:hypothetical protein